MGGRGTKLNVNAYISRGESGMTSEYKKVFQKGNIVFLKQNGDSSVSAPVFSHTPNRIYVTLEKGSIKTITVYDENRIQVKAIHVGHNNENYVHEHASLNNRGKGKLLTKSSERLYNEVMDMYNNYRKGD